MSQTTCTFRSDMTVELIDAMGDDSSIVRAMLVSTKDDDYLAEAAAEEGRIGFLMRNRHGSPFEHAAMTFRIEAPIAVFREWHRHRIGFSYNEASARYRVMEPIFYVPPPERPLVQVGKPGAYSFVPGTPEQYAFMEAEQARAHAFAYTSYEAQLDRGIAKEVARGVLGVYLFSSMYVTCNPRSLMAFLSLRTKHDGATFPSGPMWEIEQCGLAMELAAADIWPKTIAAFRANGSVCP